MIKAFFKKKQKMIDLSRNFTILFMTFYTVSFYQWVETLFYDAINLCYIASLADFFFAKKNSITKENQVLWVPIWTTLVRPQETLLIIFRVFVVTFFSRKIKFATKISTWVR